MCYVVDKSVAINKYKPTSEMQWAFLLHEEIKLANNLKTFKRLRQHVDKDT